MTISASELPDCHQTRLSWLAIEEMLTELLRKQWLVHQWRGACSAMDDDERKGGKRLHKTCTCTGI